jgi:hypothetical protein
VCCNCTIYRDGDSPQKEARMRRRQAVQQAQSSLLMSDFSSYLQGFEDAGWDHV